MKERFNNALYTLRTKRDEAAFQIKESVRSIGAAVHDTATAIDVIPYVLRADIMNAFPGKTEKRLGELQWAGLETGRNSDPKRRVQMAQLVKGMSDHDFKLLLQTVKLRIHNNGYGSDRRPLEEFIEMRDAMPASIREGRMKMYTALETSPAREVQQLKTQLEESLLPIFANKPEEFLPTLHSIEEVFLRNHLPFVGKQFRVYQILSKWFKGKMMLEQVHSPSLKKLEHSNAAFDLAIFKDLTLISLESGEPSLVNFLTLLEKSRPLLTKKERGEELTGDEPARLTDTLERLNRMLVTPKRTSVSTTPTIESLRAEFRCAEGEGLVERIEDMFLARIGFSSITDALAHAKTKRLEADGHNRAAAAESPFTESTLIKGVHSAFLKDNLQHGFFSPEFISADMKKQDRTPFDVDLTDMNVKGFSELHQSISKNYGDIFILVDTPRPSVGNVHSLEKFTIGLHGSQHAGIRTGFPSTLIRGIVMKGTTKKEAVQAMKGDIAQNGFYIPIYDPIGNIIYTPEEHDRLREWFQPFERGIDREATLQALRKEPITVDEIMTVGQQILGGLMDKQVGVAEKYNLGTHTRYVIGQFEREFKNTLPKGVDIGLYRFMLLLHDAGKPHGVAFSGKASAQHDYTPYLLETLMNASGFVPQDTDRAVSALTKDYLGAYMQGKTSIIDASHELYAGARKAGMTSKAFFAFLKPYYMADVSSYTSFAGAKASLDRLFEKKPEGLAFKEATAAKLQALEALMTDE